MGVLFFWLTWTSVAGAGVQYIAEVLLGRDISYLQSVLVILAYQWISFIKLPQKNKQINKTEQLLPKTNIVKTNQFRKKNK